MFKRNPKLTPDQQHMFDELIAATNADCFAWCYHGSDDSYSAPVETYIWGLEIKSSGTFSNNVRVGPKYRPLVDAINAYLKRKEARRQQNAIQGVHDTMSGKVPRIPTPQPEPQPDIDAIVQDLETMLSDDVQ